MISEVPGYMKRTEINGWHDTEHVGVRVMYDTDLMPFERTSRPGKQFTHGGGFADRLQATVMAFTIRIG